jgi:pyruvate dehydrogenase (quinone)
MAGAAHGAATCERARDVVVARNELVMPSKIEVSQVLGTALYSSEAILSGCSADVIDLAKAALIT